MQSAEFEATVSGQGDVILEIPATIEQFCHMSWDVLSHVVPEIPQTWKGGVIRLSFGGWYGPRGFKFVLGPDDDPDDPAWRKFAIDGAGNIYEAGIGVHYKSIELAVVEYDAAYGASTDSSTLAVVYCSEPGVRHLLEPYFTQISQTWPGTRIKYLSRSSEGTKEHIPNIADQWALSMKFRHGYRRSYILDNWIALIGKTVGKPRQRPRLDSKDPDGLLKAHLKVKNEGKLIMTDEEIVQQLEAWGISIGEFTRPKIER
jgi:hypothetical protein